jgi:fatty acid desaturase
MGMLFLLIILFPLYFIPVLNIFILNIPFYYFFYKLLNFDITSTLMTKQEEAIIRVKSGNAFHFRTIVLYLISMIPFIVLFATVFYVIYLGHGYMLELKKLREYKKIEDTNYSI